MERKDIIALIEFELNRAYGKHGTDQWGRHEFYGILKEEVDELWDTIKQDKDQVIVRNEAIQVAAMVFRYLETGDRYRSPSNTEVSGGGPLAKRMPEAAPRRPLH